MVRVCEHCGGMFTTPPSHVHRGEGRFCSRRCSRQAHTSDPVARFWSHVRITDTCWLWTGAPGARGYGSFTRRGSSPWRIKPHQMAWELAGGSPRGDWFICHTCDVRLCTRNDGVGIYVVAGVAYERRGHLYLAPAAANAADMAAKGRSLLGDRNPARLYPERLARGNRHPRHLYPERSQGERNGRARRTAAWALEVRQRYANGETQVALAAEYGVAQAYISAVVLRKVWRHVG